MLNSHPLFPSAIPLQQPLLPRYSWTKFIASMAFLELSSQTVIAYSQATFGSLFSRQPGSNFSSVQPVIHKQMAIPNVSISASRPSYCYFVHTCPAHWSRWLLLAEFWYSTSTHSAGRFPFEVLYGFPPCLFSVNLDDVGMSLLCPSCVSGWLMASSCMLFSSNTYSVPKLI